MEHFGGNKILYKNTYLYIQRKDGKPQLEIDLECRIWTLPPWFSPIFVLMVALRIISQVTLRIKVFLPQSIGIFKNVQKKVGVGGGAPGWLS